MKILHKHFERKLWIASINNSYESKLWIESINGTYEWILRNKTSTKIYE